MSRLNDLSIRAALASGWPTLTLLAGSERQILEARDQVFGLLGDLPQSDEIAPFDPEDPEEPWELRIPVPGLTGEQWQALASEEPLLRLAPGVRPAVREAEDRGLRVNETIEALGLVATLSVSVETGEVLPNVAPRDASSDERLVAVERALATAVASRIPGVAFVSDRGEDTVDAYVDRTTGQPGIRLHFPRSVFEGLSVEDLLTRRSEIVAAVASVVMEREDLGPDLRWSPLHGLQLWIPLIAASTSRGLPGGTSLSASTVVWRPEWEGLIAGSEVQVYGEVDLAIPAAHGARGSGRRWVCVDGEERCVPTWWLEPEVDPAPLVDALGASATVRAVPVPAGVVDLWDVLEPHWYETEGRVYLRLFDGVTERDVRERVYERAHTDEDEAMVRRIASVLAATPGTAAPRAGALPIRSVQDSGGRRGYEVLFGSEATDAATLGRTLGALSQLDTLHPIGSYAWVDSELVVRLWTNDLVEEAPAYRRS